MFTGHTQLLKVVQRHSRQVTLKMHDKSSLFSRHLAQEGFKLHNGMLKVSSQIKKLLKHSNAVSSAPLVNYSSMLRHLKQ